MRTTEASYFLVYPSGARVGPLDYDQRREQMRHAPAGTRWLAADGTLLGRVGRAATRYVADAARGLPCPEDEGAEVAA